MASDKLSSLVDGPDTKIVIASMCNNRLRYKLHSNATCYYKLMWQCLHCFNMLLVKLPNFLQGSCLTVSLVAMPIVDGDCERPLQEEQYCRTFTAARIMYN